NPVIMMASGSIFVYLVFKFLIICFQGTDQMFNLLDQHIIIIRIGMDQQRSLQFMGLKCRRTSTVFLYIIFDLFADMIICREQFPVVVVHIAETHHQITDRHSCIGYGITLRKIEHIQQGMETAMAPSDNTHPRTINKIIIFDHIIPTSLGIVYFQSTIVDLPLETPSITCTSPVFGSRNNVPLRNELFDDMIILYPLVAIHTTVHQYDEGVFFARIKVFWDKDVRPEYQRSACSFGCFAFDLRWRPS